MSYYEDKAKRNAEAAHVLARAVFAVLVFVAVVYLVKVIIDVG